MTCTFVGVLPYLEGHFFEQELIETMGKALVDACRELGVKDKEDAAVLVLAQRIINSAREGIHDAALLKAAAVKGPGPARKH